MTCPSCGGELVKGSERCPVCDAVVAPRVEGALAKDPRIVTPPARGRGKGEVERVEPLRDIPGLRKRERTWRDEVQERVRSRRQKRAKAGLPLFDQPDPAATLPETVPAASEATATPPLAAAPEAAVPASLAPPSDERVLAPAQEPDLRSTRLTEAELADLPLQTRGEAEPAPPTRRDVPPLDDALLGEADVEPEVEITPPVAEPGPVERPARVSERVQAGAVDALIFTGLSALVVYFAGRAAHADLARLASSWPWLAAYLGLLGLFYAGYFTGTTGQTPGKLLTGLRVVGPSGRPPSYLRAMVRAAAGVVGVAAVGLGAVPMAFDPAGRALHDRLCRTRVVRH
jgi:uncharacterized RDD family membrane protein YckC